MKRKIPVLIGGLFVIIMLILSLLITPTILSIAKNPMVFQQWVNQYGILGSLLFLCIQMLQVFVAFIPGEPLEIMAGIVYCEFWGTVLCLVGVQIASVLVFILG